MGAFTEEDYIFVFVVFARGIFFFSLTEPKQNTKRTDCSQRSFVVLGAAWLFFTVKNEWSRDRNVTQVSYPYSPVLERTGRWSRGGIFEMQVEVRAAAVRGAVRCASFGGRLGTDGHECDKIK